MLTYILALLSKHTALFLASVFRFYRHETKEVLRCPVFVIIFPFTFLLADFSQLWVFFVKLAEPLELTVAEF